MTELPYPPGPAGVPADLTAPTPSFRRRAWGASLALAAFLAIYLGLVAWLASVTWRYLAALRHGDTFVVGLLAVPAGLLLLVLVKGLFAVRRGDTSHMLEVTAADEPELVAFVRRVAADAGAPAPHRIFLSPRVNAAVFYDMAFWNLVVPSKKNLEIGLGLVNALTLDEFKAVVAHEFGHFAQRTMTVGTWVYLAQQLVGDLVTRRDGIDRFLDGLSRFDLRVAWIGWIMRLIIWSLRSVLDTAFRGVVLMQRALSRQMEFQADLVSVSVAGSDSLVHALHRLGAADEAWDRAAHFCAAEGRMGRPPADLFAVQARILEQLARILDNPGHGRTPELPADTREAHRVFRSGIAEAPRMWSSHPPNHEREANAKAAYLASALDHRSAWLLFADPAATRRRATAALFSGEPAETESTLERLDAQFARPHLDRRYRGAWLNRPVARYESEAAALCGPLSLDALDALFPETLASELALLRELASEKAALEGLREGFLEAPGGELRFRGRAVRRRELPALIAEVEREHGAVQARVHGHDRVVRGAHRAAARRLGRDWEEYLAGLLAILHYAEHSEADVDDARDALRNVLAIVTADRSVSRSEMNRLVQAGIDVHLTLRGLYDHRGEVRITGGLRERFDGLAWSEVLPAEFKLQPPTAQSLAAGWIDAMDSWVDVYSNVFGALRSRALDTLVAAEDHVAACVKTGADPGEAPEPPAAPTRFLRRMPGKERPKQKRLGWWDRFLLADGAFAGTARLGVALAVLLPTVAATWGSGTGTLVVHNGFDVPVTVSFDGEETMLHPRETMRFDRGAGTIDVIAATADGREIERFSADGPGAYATVVYNIAGLSLLGEWTAVYGSGEPVAPRLIGAVRWYDGYANHYFEPPPTQLSDDGARRTVLEALDDTSVADQVVLLGSDAERVRGLHQRWDSAAVAAEWN